MSCLWGCASKDLEALRWEYVSLGRSEGGDYSGALSHQHLSWLQKRKMSTPRDNGKGVSYSSTVGPRYASRMQEYLPALHGIPPE
jgi:hypothetical protein